MKKNQCKFLRTNRSEVIPNYFEPMYLIILVIFLKMSAASHFLESISCREKNNFLQSIHSYIPKKRHYLSTFFAVTGMS